MPKYLVCQNAMRDKYGVCHILLDNEEKEDLVSRFIEKFHFYDQNWEIVELEHEVQEYHAPNYFYRIFHVDVWEPQIFWWNNIRHSLECDQCLADSSFLFEKCYPGEFNTCKDFQNTKAFLRAHGHNF